MASSIHKSPSHEHLSQADLFFVQCRLVDASGRPVPDREAILPSRAANRIQAAIASCEFCAKRVSQAADLPEMGFAAASRSILDSAMKEAFFVERFRGWKHGLTAAAVFVFFFSSLFHLSHKMHAWRGQGIVKTGNAMVGNDSGEKIVILRGLRKSGEIQLEPKSIVVLQNSERNQEWKLLEGNAEVNISETTDSASFSLPAGSIQTVSFPVPEEPYYQEEQPPEVHFRVETRKMSENEPGTVTITVFKGSIQYTPESGAAIQLKTGDQARVRFDKGGIQQVETTLAVYGQG